jgi:hypothetical protein
MHGRLVSAGLGGLALLLAHSVAAAQCTMDTECKGDRVCEKGKCVSPAPAPAPAAAAPAPDGTAPATAPTETVPAPAADPSVAPAPPPAAAPPAAAAAPPPAPGLRPLEPVRPPDEAPVRRVNRTAMIGGIVMVSIAPLALLGALAARNAQVECDENLERDYPDHVVPTSQSYRLERCDGYSTPLYVLGIGGAVLAVAGVPLIIYGARTAPSSQQASLRIDPWASRTSGGVRLRLDL